MASLTRAQILAIKDEAEAFRQIDRRYTNDQARYNVRHLWRKKHDKVTPREITTDASPVPEPDNRTADASTQTDFPVPEPVYQRHPHADFYSHPYIPSVLVIPLFLVLVLQFFLLIVIATNGVA